MGPEKVKKALRNEHQLVALLKEENEEAFRVFMKGYEKRIFRIAYGITLDREESLDIVQEVFIRVYRSIAGFREESSLSTWLHRITVNQCLNWKRRWKRRLKWHHRSMDEEEPVGDPALAADDRYRPDTLFREKEAEKRFWDALKGLPNEARAAFTLRELEGLSYEEIAAALNIRKGTVSSRLFHARKRLREAMKPYLGDEQK
jgi:RNA polymerase sigma-70 factor (ECF subfamily)